MKTWYVGLVLVLVVVVLAGCGGGSASPVAADVDSSVTSDGTETPTSTAISAAVMADVDSSATSGGTALDASYPDALDQSGQLALGTMRLEGTEQAVTPEQATTLLPLWQVIREGSLQGDAETNAIISQIQGAMTPEQLEAIVAMQLTAEDLQSWAQEQGLGSGAGRGEGQAGGGQNLSEEERAERLAQFGDAEGGPPAGFGELSEEEREAMRATIEAGGMPAGGVPGAGSGQLTIVLNPLVDMLTQRAAG